MSECDLSADEAVPGTAVVLRFTPVTAVKVLDRAQASHDLRGSDDDPRFFSSVLVDREATDPADEDVHLRLLHAAELSHLHPGNNKYYYVTTAGALYEVGLEFKKDRYDGEIEQHYSVDLGAAPTLETAERFLSVFDRGKVGDIWTE